MKRTSEPIPAESSLNRCKLCGAWAYNSDVCISCYKVAIGAKP